MNSPSALCSRHSIPDTSITVALDLSTGPWCNICYNSHQGTIPSPAIHIYRRRPSEYRRRCQDSMRCQSRNTRCRMSFFRALQFWFRGFGSTQDLLWRASLLWPREEWRQKFSSWLKIGSWGGISRHLLVMQRLFRSGGEFRAFIDRRLTFLGAPNDLMLIIHHHARIRFLQEADSSHSFRLAVSQYQNI